MTRGVCIRVLKRRNTVKKLLVSSVVVVAAALSATPAFATTGGKVAVDVTINPLSNTATAQVVLAGAISDYGTATSIDKNGKTDPNGNYEKVVLKHGTFEVNSTTFNKASNSASPTISSTSGCSVDLAVNGPVTFFKGTGSYKGISGTIQMTQVFVGIASKLKDGKCNESNNAAPIAAGIAFYGTGTVSFSS
jgi:uncharacterized membrane protein